MVDFDDPEREVGHGERGRVKLTTLTKEFFVPGFLERDEAIRLLRAWWSDPQVDFDGRFYTIKAMAMEPKPPQGSRTALL